MSVNGIELAINQRWLTRDGQEVEITDESRRKEYPWVAKGDTGTYTVTNHGIQVMYETNETDLITLIQDEHGFIPWNGGECPVDDEFEPVEYKMRDCSIAYIDAARNLYWENTGGYSDIIAYRVVKQEEKTKEVVVEAKTEAKEESKYTIKQVYEAINRVTTCIVHMDEIGLVEEELVKTQDPDYKLYLELKARFE